MRIRKAGTLTLGGAALVCALFSGGCASWYAASADREVHGILDYYHARSLADLEQRAVRPASAPAPEPISDADIAAGDATPTSVPAESDVEPTSAPADSVSDGDEAMEDANATPTTAPTTLPDDTAELIDLPAALRRAFSSSRQFLDAKESLYLAGLDYSLTRYRFGPILDATIAYVWSDRIKETGSDSHGGEFSVRQVLPFGGSVSVSAETTGDRTVNAPPFGVEGGDFEYVSGFQVNLRQPLLRGAGHAIAWEDLTQGKRDVIYALREFELFRQDLCISIAQNYYSLVTRKQRLEIARQQYKDAVFDREKAEALRSVDRNTDTDVFQARRREVEAEDSLLVAETDYKLGLDDFKILLGMPTSAAVRVADVTPPFTSVSVDPESAIDVTLQNRLDLHTLRDRVDDTRRRVTVARNQLLPDLDVTADYSMDSERDGFDETLPEDWSATVGLTLSLPLDRKAERNAYRTSLITLDQRRRNLKQREDEVTRDVLNQLRELQQVESRIEIQRGQVEFEQRAVEVTRIRYEAGNVDIRDLLDARTGLASARISLVDLQARHFVERLRLLRILGILFVDENGMWRE